MDTYLSDNEFSVLAQKFGCALTDMHLKKFRIYQKELSVWNEHTNLTAIKTEREIYIKHFLDSLSCAPHIPTSAQTLIDIGTGAGFPGIPLALLRPDLTILLVESVGKKVSFLEHIITILDLKNVQVLTARAEAIAQDKKYREKFDVATARAVAHLPTLLEYLLPLIKVGGICITPKNASQEEIDSATSALEILGGTIKNTIPVILPETPKRALIIIEKIKATPSDYPRSIGTPLKNPL